MPFGLYAPLPNGTGKGLSTKKIKETDPGDLDKAADVLEVGSGLAKQLDKI